MSRSTLELHDLHSTVRGADVPTAVVLPPGHTSGAGLPLLISLHGGGSSRDHVEEFLPVFEGMFDDATIPPLAIVGFSSGPGSWYGGSWERFVTDELPRWMHETYGTRIDRDGTVMTGISMGGYGTLKIALKNPRRFRAIAAMEPAIEPSLGRLPGGRRNTWYRMPPMEAAVWGDPLDEAAWLADNPATVLRDNAAAVRESGLELEPGEQAHVDWVASGMVSDPPSAQNMLADPVRAPSVHARIWDPLRETAKDDPAMKRAYAELGPTR